MVKKTNKRSGRGGIVGLPPWNLGLRLRYLGAGVATPLLNWSCCPRPYSSSEFKLPAPRQPLLPYPHNVCSRTPTTSAPTPQPPQRPYEPGAHSGRQTPRDSGEFRPRRGKEVWHLVGSSEGPSRWRVSFRVGVETAGSSVLWGRTGVWRSWRYGVREWERASGVVEAGKWKDYGCGRIWGRGEKKVLGNNWSARSWDRPGRRGGWRTVAWLGN